MLIPSAISTPTGRPVHLVADFGGARERNIGWRIDYFFVATEVLPRVAGAFILPEVRGSDHCPVGLRLDVPEPAS